MGALVALVVVFLIANAIRKLTFHKVDISKWKVFVKATKLFDRNRPGAISLVDLIDISMRNMAQKRTRAMVTIGGMGIGIASIVFLVSIGYGLQELVISRVARLEEMRQMDVIPQVRGVVALEDKSLESIKNLSGVSEVLPLIAAVGRVNYNASASDAVVYGVTTEYLSTSAVKPVTGTVFQNEDTIMPSLAPTQAPTVNATLTPKSTVTQVVDKDSGWVVINDDGQATENIVTIPLGGAGEKEAVVNRAFLGVLGLNENEAVGKEFEVSFVVVGALSPEGVDKLQSVPTRYKITGVTPDATSPVMYVPFVHLRSMGVQKFSQAKVVVQNEKNLQTIRQQIEAMGFTTQSVVDTVAQINSLFSSLRLLLLLLGMVALGVAALGMFNTLTVSLLERTREVGLLKAMGMKSNEIQELFFTESIIMGLAGGFMGLGLGYLAGKLMGLLLSLFTISKGAGYIDISYLPWAFIAVIALISLAVGVLTGMYPARRATKISALNALRYE
jgi:ABC-type antimicrobial peptide transport system permease subunit